MKYCSVNSIHDFEFHDCFVRLVSWDKNTLIVTAEHLNIHKNATQNPYDADMELDKALITFTGLIVEAFEPIPASAKDEAGCQNTTDMHRIYIDGEVMALFEKEIIHGLHIKYLEHSDGNKCTIEACGDEPYFSVRLSFDSVTVKWDGYRRKAWYELHKNYKKEILLETPEGDVVTEMHIHCCYQDHSNTQAEDLTVTAGIKYGGKEIRGIGHSYLWEDAFADLQKKLPEGVSLKCCLTCRHGNMCPVGNYPGELFCTKDVEITQKSDLFFYTEDDGERTKRSRESTAVCDDFEKQSREHYTYNSYLYYFK